MIQCESILLPCQTGDTFLHLMFEYWYDVSSLGSVYFHRIIPQSHSKLSGVWMPLKTANQPIPPGKIHKSDQLLAPREKNIKIIHTKLKIHGPF